MTDTVTVDIAGGQAGGAARYAGELRAYLTRTPRPDVHVIGSGRHVGQAWLVRREMSGARAIRRIAVNNVSFVAPGGERWTLLRNALHFLTEEEESGLDPSLRSVNRRKTAIVRLTARRADVLVAPCSAMAERVISILPSVRNRIVVRPHPVSAHTIGPTPLDDIILCPVIFESYKRMTEHISEFLAAVDRHIDHSVKLYVTAERSEVPTDLAAHPRLHFTGRLPHSELRALWGRSRAIFFPPGLESFGYPVAEARVNGKPVISQDTKQNQEIGGAALSGFTTGDPRSLLSATLFALTTEVKPDPAPFDPDSYFNWLLDQ